MTRAKKPGTSKPRRRKGDAYSTASRPGWLPGEAPAAPKKRGGSSGKATATPAWMPAELEPQAQAGRKGAARKAAKAAQSRGKRTAPVADPATGPRTPPGGGRRPMLDDPNAEREAQRYENPIPSRDALLAFLDEQGTPMGAEALAAALGLTAPDRFFALTKRLGAMLRDGQLLVNRRGDYVVAEKLDLVPGTVIANQDGFGFLKPDAGGDDLFLPPYEMRQVLHGDRVLASVTGVDRRGRREAAIVEVLERGNTRLVGRYSERDGLGYVLPDDRRMHLDVLVPPGQAANARNNQIVVCEITQQPTRQQPPFGRVVEVLGDTLTPSLAVEVAIHGHGLPYQWPEAVLEQANAVPLEVTAADRAGREDLRELPLVTIDGEDAKDFDDA